MLTEKMGIMATDGGVHTVAAMENNGDVLSPMGCMQSNESLHIVTASNGSHVNK